MPDPAPAPGNEPQESTFRKVIGIAQVRDSFKSVETYLTEL
jgi:hypothetical protein